MLLNTDLKGAVVYVSYQSIVRVMIFARNCNYMVGYTSNKSTMIENRSDYHTNNILMMDPLRC